MARRGLAVLLLMAGVAVIGCAPGMVEMTALDFGHIDPPAAQVFEMPLDQCYWWADEDGRLWVAGRRRFAVPFAGEFGRIDFRLSLRLDGPPAGSAREFQVRADGLRAVLRAGPQELRFESRDGIVAAYRRDGGVLEIIGRIRASRRNTTMLGSWSEPSQYLMLLRMKAGEDARAGQPIAAETETQGFERRPPREPRRLRGGVPASQPAGWR